MPSELLKKLKQTFKKVKFKQTYGLSEIGVMRTKSKDNDSLSIKVGGEDYKIKIINEILYINQKVIWLVTLMRLNHSIKMVG